MRRGFTLLETALAATIGGFVILATVGLFGLMERTETVLERQFTQTRQLGTLQQVLRRSFNAVLMSEDNTTSLSNTTNGDDKVMGSGEIVEDDVPAWDGQGERPRVILTFDSSEDLSRCMSLAPPEPGDPMGVPQRLEMVYPRSPIPASLRLPTRSWMAQGVDVENELEIYGISGPVRGVFEFRPDGSREAMLKSAGMGVAGGERDDRQQPRGWTLWWRPVFPDEVTRLSAGIPAGDQEMVSNAAEAYPVIRGVKRARILAFDNKFRLMSYAARTAADLPAYFEVEIETWAGEYVNWMFEVGWVNGDDPTAAPETTGTDAADSPQNNGQNNNGGGNNNGGQNGQPGRLNPSSPRSDPQRAPQIRRLDRNRGQRGGGES